GIGQKNITGGTGKLEFINTFTRYPALFNPLNPDDRSALALSYTQPLLKGAGVSANIAPINIARINTERSYFQFKDSMQEMVRGVVEAYWNLWFARENAKARDTQMKQGKEAYDLGAAKLSAGRGTLGEKAQAETAFRSFESTWIAAEANVLQREA